jgi:SAM-dependent methyltransferase
MKLRESGMPEEDYWETLLDVEATLDALGFSGLSGDAVEFGCGYGTFTLTAARRTTGNIYTFDIEPDMVRRTQGRCAEAGVGNVRATQRDLASDGTGLPDASVAVVMIFNLLHCEAPKALLREARRILCDEGVLLATHWIHDASTPRGPSLDIRPKPEAILRWAAACGFATEGVKPVPLPPYHYGLRLPARSLPAP